MPWMAHIPWSFKNWQIFIFYTLKFGLLTYEPCQLAQYNNYTAVSYELRPSAWELLFLHLYRPKDSASTVADQSVERVSSDNKAPAERRTVIGVLAVWPRVRECLATATTLIRLLAAMQSTVLSQMMFVFERALTHVAWERPQTCPHSTANNNLINMHEHSVNTTLMLLYTAKV